MLGGMMYLVQAGRLKRKRLAIPGLKLPSLQWLERWNHWAVIVTVFAFGIGIGLGVGQNLLMKRIPIPVEQYLIDLALGDRPIACIEMDAGGRLKSQHGDSRFSQGRGNSRSGKDIFRASEAMRKERKGLRFSSRPIEAGRQFMG